MAQHSRSQHPAQTAQTREGVPPVGDAQPAGSAAREPGSSVRKLFGIALLWVALAALVCVPSAGGGAGAALAGVGFLAFAAGLSLFADAFKRELVASLRAGSPR